jgi:1-aminocyclopropane-1-carboxylate deaminase/D-cysteine desulfhydrase-like pyridoxal-dependent ACC family enzyme
LVEIAEAPGLFARLPEVAGRIPWLRLTDGVPTPVERLGRLGARFGLRELWVKRDDRTSSRYGGNKVRKLEWLLADARARGRKSVSTFGAWGSHHALATAVFCAQTDLTAYLVLCPQPLTPHVEENLLADLGAGARIVPIAHFVWLPLGFARARRRSKRDGLGAPYRIPPGGSSVRGTLGYVECGLEIAAQVAAGAMPPPDIVYAAAGTCGTVSGLSLGLALGAREVPELSRTTVVGVRVVPKQITSARRLRALTRGVRRLLGRAGAADVPEAVAAELLDGHLGRGYGHETKGAREVAALAGDLEGLELDTTYTAKCVDGLRAFASAPERRDLTHLYVHTLSSAPLDDLVARGRDAEMEAGLAAALARAR